MGDRSDQPLSVQRIDAQNARRVRWRNDLGWTREIHVEHAPDERVWRWRLSVTEIEQPAAFSRFEGVERELMLRTGNGLVLRFADGEVCNLQPPHARLRFAGDRAVSGEPAGAGVSALNLMWRPDSIDASTWHRPLVGRMVIFVDPGECWLVHALTGQVRFGASRSPALESGDSLLLRAPDGRCHHALDGGGELLLARFRTVAAAV
ncbi:conserved hypothetical protein [Luteimonas sp. 9C]|uniref:HutD/Ves family protein n=1 Tax=Luteimonas sp. 9C TaxID=2653148 RepID=UPI0012F1DDCD|nr:HutD family protein [Luteimonas sp. 9C]VXB46773.1 conserved hypothetical protein [Luteimonas sp. 9C]